MLVCGAITQATGRWPLTAGAWVRSQASPCGLCGGHSDTVAGLLIFYNMNHSCGKPFPKQYPREQKSPCMVETTPTVVVSPYERRCVRCVLSCEGVVALFDRQVSSRRRVSEEDGEPVSAQLEMHVDGSTEVVSVLKNKMRKGSRVSNTN
jgi:hypothetical protein